MRPFFFCYLCCTGTRIGRVFVRVHGIPFDVLFVLYCPKLFAMQQFKLSRLALLKNDEHAMLIEQVCRILDDHPVDDTGT